MVDADRVNFPALCIAANGFVYAAIDQATLESCSKSAFRAGYFVGLRLFDDAGRAGVVRGATQVGVIGCQVGWRLWRLLRTEFIRVQLDVEWLPGRVSLHELQDLVRQAIDQLPDQCDDFEDGVDTVKGMVRRAQATHDVVQIFSSEVFDAKELGAE